LFPLAKGKNNVQITGYYNNTPYEDLV